MKGSEHLTVHFCPTPSQQNDLASSTSSETIPTIMITTDAEHSKRVLKKLPETQNSFDAERFIRKSVCAYLTIEYKNKGYFEKDRNDNKVGWFFFFFFTDLLFFDIEPFDF